MIIGLCDMDCFFASVEQRDDVSLRGKPIAVGSTDRRGVVATCSYEARKFGVRSAMASSIAKTLCPDLIFVKPNFEKYREASQAVINILSSYSSEIEQVSIDEAYIDLTEASNDDFGLAKEISQNIRAEIEAKIGITATIGLSSNKFVAKVASSIKKPNCLNVVEPNDVYDFIGDLPISEFRGVGNKTLEVFTDKGITSGGDLRNTSLEVLKTIVGESRAMWFYLISRGVDNRRVETEKEPRKSIGLSKTYDRDIKTDRIASTMLIELAGELADKMHDKNLKGKTLTLKIRFSDFTMITRSRTLQHYENNQNVTLKTVFSFFEENKLTKPVRLFGLSYSNLDNDQKYDLW